MPRKKQPTKRTEVGSPSIGRPVTVKDRSHLALTPIQRKTTSGPTEETKDDLALATSIAANVGLVAATLMTRRKLRMPVSQEDARKVLFPGRGKGPVKKRTVKTDSTPPQPKVQRTRSGSQDVKASAQATEQVEAGKEILRRMTPKERAKLRTAQQDQRLRKEMSDRYIWNKRNEDIIRQTSRQRPKGRRLEDFGIDPSKKRRGRIDDPYTERPEPYGEAARILLDPVLNPRSATPIKVEGGMDLIKRKQSSKK